MYVAVSLSAYTMHMVRLDPAGNIYSNYLMKSSNNFYQTLDMVMNH